MLKFTCCDAVQQFSRSGQAQILRGITRGYERECLRVDSAGKLAATPHPVELGSKLTHPWITTDYSEALLEFITPPSQDPEFPLAFLRDIHRFSAQHLHGEYMWAGSMPCVVGQDKDIPIADYGSSNAARFKYVYREGLGLRYGRQMQTIAGAHYNWSLPEDFWAALKDCCSASQPDHEFVSERYFGLIRNFQRYGWLIPYLFGASPAICQSFLQGRKSDLLELVPGTLYGPYATSLRMSDLGYQNRAQANLRVGVNSLTEYTQALEAAIRTPDPFYAELGVRDGPHWKQLNANLLQIENEFYAGMRPKRIGKLGERPAKALQRYGVEYVEMRLFDLNPFIDIGIAPEQSTFADVLLLMCLFRDSPPITSREQSENDENRRRVVNRGRQPGLQLLAHNREQPFRPLAHELFDDMQPFAEMLDAAYGGKRYSSTLQGLRGRIDQPDSTPSAQVLAGAREQGGFFSYALQLSQQHLNELLAQPLDEVSNAKFVTSVQTSLLEQQQLEAKDQGTFENFVTSYYD
ncbi:MAG: glutamate--cysteine ligase [Rhodoferax sp.]|uniref:glutamate--cysteine ligase n=1 Tax=Rhodoferax sp. TaxID=50421 RepID=UPI002719CEBF|nr:glutamate--cysteine ligase [Rhodoferax sp.]MDO8448184.1 glutamate--cysteine ligase [Rhodoferax sp.]